VRDSRESGVNFLSFTNDIESGQFFLAKRSNDVADFLLEHRQEHAQLDLDINLMRVQRQGSAGTTAMEIQPVAMPDTGNLVFGSQFIDQVIQHFADDMFWLVVLMLDRYLCHELICPP
jgi:hypothetical protein